MRPRAYFAVLFSLAAAAIFSITLAAQTRDAEQTVLQLERDWEQANTTNDSALLERILAPEFVSTDSDGRLVTRAEGFERRKSGQVKYSQFTQDEYEVQVIGDTAIVTGRSIYKGVRDGKDISGRDHWTDVFVRRNGRWQAVASHSSRIATQ